MRYVIPGVPIPLQRVRFAQGRCWDSQKRTKAALQIILSGQHDNAPLYEGPISVEFDFYFPFPQSVSRAKRNEMRLKHHKIKPDLDNLIKMYLDISTGILYQDDRIVAHIVARKWYDDSPRTEFVITEI